MSIIEKAFGRGLTVVALKGERFSFNGELKSFTLNSFQQRMFGHKKVEELESILNEVGWVSGAVIGFSKLLGRGSSIYWSLDDSLVGEMQLRKQVNMQPLQILTFPVEARILLP